MNVRTRPKRGKTLLSKIFAATGPIVFGVLSAIPPQAQSAQTAPVATPKFEVASIKACSDSDPRGGRGGGRGQQPVPQSSPGRLRLVCKTVEELMQDGYVRYANGQLSPSRLTPIVGGPAWIHSDRYTIEAKGEGPVNEGTMNGPMLQALLEDRFQLKMHRVIRETSVYQLVLSKDGPKLTPHEEGSCRVIDATETSHQQREDGVTYCGDVTGKGNGLNQEIYARGISLDDFCKKILSNMDRPVIDKTGLAGLFDIHLKYVRDDAAESLRRMAETVAIPDLREQILARADALESAAPGISIAAALEQQLGLKLVSARGPGETLVIDRVERLSDN